MTRVNVDRCEKHNRFRFNGICLACRNEIATALAKDKIAALRSGDQ